MTRTSRTRSPRRLSQRLGALALTVGALTAGGAAAAPHASAAGDTSKPDIYGCFIWGGGVAYAGQPVYLQWWDASTNKWVSSRSGTTNSSGCIRFNDISVGRYYHLEAYKFYGSPLWYYYIGDTGYVRTASGDSLYKVSTPTNPTYVYGPYSV